MDIGALLFLFFELMMLLRLWCCTESSLNPMHCKVVSLGVLGYGHKPIISSLGPIGFGCWRITMNAEEQCWDHIQGCVAHH